jgi:phospho-N-acetylmuramoyl-pentapeptide-transferase
MFYNLLYPLHEIISVFNIFRYITFRAAMAVITSFVISLILGPILIKKLKALKVGEKVNKGDSVKLDDLHRSKRDTPTMGGLFILISVVVSTLLWSDWQNKYTWVVLFSTTWLGITGFADDYLKQIKSKAKGLSAKHKFSSQIILGLVLGVILLVFFQDSSKLEIPFIKNASLDLDGLYVIFVILVVAGTSNAVNLTDGLDGLAIGIVIMVALAFSVLCYVSGNIKLSDYFLVPYLNGSGELTIFCASIFGAGLGFLWFNCYPATVFMGDVGSLALGGALGTVALLIRKEILLVIVGGIFVVEALSVILQVASFRLIKKRIFKIAPLHHHFQFLNWPENKVIVRFWIIAALLALLTIATLKIR